MSTKYHLADFLSTLVNCSSRDIGDEVVVIANKFCQNVASILKECGYVSDYAVYEERPGVKKMRVAIRFNRNRNILTSAKLISKPSRRVYMDARTLKLFVLRDRVRTVIVSTSFGIMTADAAISKGIGGELLCKLF
jgi:small subunit ribosomal protein S8